MKLKAAIHQASRLRRELIMSAGPLAHEPSEDGALIHVLNHHGPTDVELDFGPFKANMEVSVRAFVRVPKKYQRMVAYGARKAGKTPKRRKLF